MKSLRYYITILNRVDDGAIVLLSPETTWRNFYTHPRFGLDDQTIIRKSLPGEEGRYQLLHTYTASEPLSRVEARRQLRYVEEYQRGEITVYY